MNEAYDTIKPLNSFQSRLTPDEKLTESAIESLIYRKLISIHPESGLGNFRFGDGSITGYKMWNVSWKPAFKITTDSITTEIKQFEKVLEDSDQWPEGWWEQMEPFWKELAFAEVLEFLEYWLQRHNIPHSPGEKTYKVIASLQDEFSSAEICYFIWAKMKDTTLFLAREDAPKRVATSYLLSCMENFADKVKVYNWNTISFDRNNECLITATANVFYNKVLKMDGFKNIPQI